jgi:uncharacterized glyoxalase superfamily protein PhnB
MSAPVSPAPAAAPPLPCTHAIPCLTYRDAPAAVRWLVEVLGAEARQVHPGPDDTVAHAELWFGAGCVMLGSAKHDGRMPEGTGTGTVYLVLATREAVDALHARVVAAGARVTVPLRDTDYGSRDFVCRDPEGNAWSFGTYAPA